MAVNSFSSSRTVLATWASRGIDSQIDYLVVHPGNCMFTLQSVTAKTSHSHKSDHKFVLGVLIGQWACGYEGVEVIVQDVSSSEATGATVIDPGPTHEAVARVQVPGF